VPGSDRFAWHLGPKRGGLQVDVLACQETPRGWREGERLPLRALPSPGTPPWTSLGQSEQGAFEALRVWSRNPAGLPFPLLSALEGHSRLSWVAGSDQVGSRVALVRELAALEVRETPEGWHLALSLRPDGGPARLRLDRDRLLFTGFAPIHRLLDGLLGEGRLLGMIHTNRLAALLGRLMPHLPLLTDLLPEPAPTEAPPDRALRIWAKGGGERLDLSLRAQAGPGLNLTLPGEGRRFAVAGDPTSRQLWRRDLLLEGRRREQLQALLPPSVRSLAEPLSWRIEGREAVARFLAELREQGGRIHLDGVPGLVPALPQAPQE